MKQLAVPPHRAIPHSIMIFGNWVFNFQKLEFHQIRVPKHLIFLWANGKLECYTMGNEWDQTLYNLMPNFKTGTKGYVMPHFVRLQE